MRGCIQTSTMIICCSYVCAFVYLSELTAFPLNPTTPAPQNIHSLGIRLDTMDQELSSGPEPVANTTAAMLKKLRNDLRKEEGLFQRLVTRLEEAEQEANGMASSQGSSRGWAGSASPSSIAAVKSVSSPRAAAKKPM